MSRFTPRPKSLRELDAEVLRWNENVPAGTEVFYHPVIGKMPAFRTVTTGAAFVLSSHTACVSIKRVPGINGGIVALDALEVA